MNSAMSSITGCLISIVLINLILLTSLDQSEPEQTTETLHTDARWSVVSFGRNVTLDYREIKDIPLSEVFMHAGPIPAMRAKDTIFKNELLENSDQKTSEGEGKEATATNEEADKKEGASSQNMADHAAVIPAAGDVITEDWKRILNISTIGYHAFNTTASDSIPVQRDVPDTRLEACRTITYDVHSLQQTSVIIIFHNEARSTLLRTIHSILDRTPEYLLLEILLVDDASSYPWLREPLADYVDHLDKVRLIRNLKREGLIRARMRGADEAKGEVLFFVDAHTEVNRNWLEPMLSRIKENRKVLTVPQMDIINPDTFDYQGSAGLYYGSFDWTMVYRYKPYPKYRLANRTSQTEPMVSPTMVGCAHAIDRKYFYETGAYDLGMNIWGGENLEHAFRLWMCGGRVEIIPCSKVAHVFKPRLPYAFPGGPATVITGNLIRTAEVWMDEYKKYFYATQNKLPPIDIDTLAERKAIKGHMECKSFDWYMKTITPEMPVPPDNAVYFGRVTRKTAGDTCLHVDPSTYTLKTIYCDDQDEIDKQFVIDTKGVFSYKQYDIAQVFNKSMSVGNWEWDQKTHVIKQPTSSLCFELSESENTIGLQPCNENEDRQKWEFQHTFDFSQVMSVEEVLRNHTTPPKNAVYFGQLKNQGVSLCLDVMDDYDYAMVACPTQPKYKRIIHLDSDARLRYGKYCFRVSPNNDLMILECKALFSSVETIWTFDHPSRLLKVKNKDVCLVFGPNSGGKVRYAHCDPGDPYQRWKFSFHFKEAINSTSTSV